MNIQEENFALYFRVQSEREQTLVILLHLPIQDSPSGLYPVLQLNEQFNFP